MDIVGKTFNHLTVLSYEGRNNHQQKVFLCHCNRCGNEKVMIGSAVKNGYSKSCGCLANSLIKERTTTHGMSKTRIYRKWKGMLARCYNSNMQNYQHYGARGIKVCDEWRHDFSKFYEDMGDIPFEKAELDRIDNDKDYCKENCRWVSHRDNCDNRRTYHNKTGYTGVTYKPKIGKYQAQLYKNKKFTYLGVYDTPEEAYQVYLKAKEQATVMI